MNRDEPITNAGPTAPVNILAMLTAVVTWQLLCVVMRSIYLDFFERPLLDTYTRWFGNLASNYGTSARLLRGVELQVITQAPTIVALLLFNHLDGRHAGRRHVVAAFCLWQLSITVLLVFSYESGLSSLIKQIDWKLFGQPSIVRSVRHLFVPRVAAWLMCTVPISTASLWGMALSGRRSEARRTFRIANRHSIGT